MSQAQLDAVIRDVQATFGAWTADTSLAQMREGWDALSSSVASTIAATHTPVDAGGVRAVWIDAPGVAQDRVVMYLHGGGYVFGGPRSHGALGEQFSKSANARVLFVDYRLAPEHPFPAAVEDALTVWRWLVTQGYKPARMSIAGDSAGGGLTLATLLSIKTANLPMPACATPISPWADMTLTGDSMTSKADVDPIVQKPLVENLIGLFLPGGQVRDPRISPLYGDLSGLPPLLIQVGERETLLDDSRRIAARAKEAGVDVTLDVWAGQIHVFQVFCARLDEAVQALEQLGAFVHRHTG